MADDYMSNFEVFMCFWNQNKITVMLLQRKSLILSFNFFRCTEASNPGDTILKRVRKAFHQDLKGRWKSNESLWVSLKNASDTRANIVTNAGTLQTMGGNG